MELFSYQGWLFLLRWFHFLAGITWIGMLYYFNFVQTPFFAGAEAPVRMGMLAGGLVNRALLLIIHYMGEQGIREFFNSPRGMLIFIGGMLGSLMWFNVWFVIWPAQQVLMASAAQVVKGGQAIPEAAARGQRAGFASRTNTLLSIPMLFFMGTASHLPFITRNAPRGSKIGALVLLLIVLAAAEINAMVGTTGAGKKILGTLKGTFWAGFVLTAIMYFALELLYP
jgi:uncharacterized membrane protein